MKNPKAKIVAGDSFGRLTIIKELEKENYNRQFLCKCDCGNETQVDSSKLLSGNTKSCGCLKSELLTKNNKTHGMSGTKIYSVWESMKQRCLNKNDKSYSNYGDRGIKICKEWLEFEPFYEWAIENGYREGLMIDRVDNDGNYEPDNCQWVKRKTQNNNRRNNRNITFEGKTKTMAQWSRDLEINYGTLKYRLNNDWSVKKALTTPVNN